MKLKQLPILILSLSAAFVTQTAMACACCARKGTYQNFSEKMDEYRQSSLEGLKIKGTIEETSQEDDITYTWKFTGIIKKDLITLELLSNGNLAGVITITTGNEIQVLQTDALVQPATDAILYKQMVMKGQAQTHDSLLKRLMGNAEIIIKGEGNACMNPATDFQQIIININNKIKNSSITAFGTLSPTN